MKTIELTDKQYTALLSFKNYMTLKLRFITNTEVGSAIQKSGGMTDEIRNEMDFEPEYSFGECIVDTIGSVMLEQQTGEVNYIT